MARNGTGTYVLPAGQPVVTNTTISSTTFNTLTADLSVALTQSVCTDGQTPMTGNLPMGSNKITNLAAGTAASDAARFDQILTPARFGSTGLIGRPNSTTPLTKYAIGADFVELINSNNNSLVVEPGASLVTCAFDVAGPIANGRDQAAVFPANSWIYIYFIYNGTTLASLASLTGLPTGPTLPSGYTHWCLAGVIRWDGSSNIVSSDIRGNRLFYPQRQTALLGGTAVVETSVNITSLVPTAASSYFGQIAGICTASGASAASNSILIRTATTVNTFQLDMFTAISQTSFNNSFIELTNRSNALFYLNTVAGAPTTANTTIYINGYTLPNNAT